MVWSVSGRLDDFDGQLMIQNGETDEPVAAGPVADDDAVAAVAVGKGMSSSAGKPGFQENCSVAGAAAAAKAGCLTTAIDSNYYAGRRRSRRAAGPGEDAEVGGSGELTS